MSENAQRYTDEHLQACVTRFGHNRYAMATEIFDLADRIAELEAQLNAAKETT